MSLKRIAILGSTGSIGTSTLKVVRNLKEEIQVVALAAGSNIELLAEQAKELRPKVIAVFDEGKLTQLKAMIPEFHIVCGMQGLIEAACHEDVDLVISAITGAIGIEPTVAAIKAGKDIALANKEVLVAAGEYVMGLAKQYKVSILPVDSEHSAIFQCLQGSSIREVSRLILTASGGPFYRLSREEMLHVTKEMALRHPTWNMGAKITIDSSTLMNKGLEVIEAYHLFGIKEDKIDVVIHPQSFVHSMVEFIDGSMLAQTSAPTMLIPIQYALTYPHRKAGMISPLDFTKFSNLEFILPEKGQFICLELAYEALRKGGSLPCYLNAANEILVSRFLKGEIRWIDISSKLEKLLLSHHIEKNMDLSKVFAVDSIARREAQTV